MSGFDIILEALVAILLVATIAYAAVLNRKLNTLRQGRSDFEAFVKDLNQAIDRAEQGTVAFRDLSDRSAHTLDRTVKEAQALKDDLRLLIDRGARLADQLADQVRKGPEFSSVAAGAPSSPAEASGEPELELDGELPPESQEKLRKLIGTLR